MDVMRRDESGEVPDRLIFRGRVYVHDGTKRPDYRGVEVVAEAQHAGAVGALTELVRLKDGPRDDAYRAAKDDAWARARDVVGVPQPRRAVDLLDEALDLAAEALDVPAGYARHLKHLREKARTLKGGR